MSKDDKVKDELDTLVEEAVTLWRCYKDDGDYTHAQYIEELTNIIDISFKIIKEVYDKPAPTIELKTKADVDDWNKAQFETENQ